MKKLNSIFNPKTVAVIGASNKKETVGYGLFKNLSNSYFLDTHPPGVYIDKHPHMRKNTTIQRLNIVKGQIDGLIRLIEKKENCQQITEQFYAINSGLKKAVEMYFKENLSSCLKSINLEKSKKIEFLLKEIINNK